jgi:hypothetical protein
MTVSALKEIESCPRRWALMSADYPDLWAKRGYPPRLLVAGLRGNVVHIALETVAKALSRAGCTSVHDGRAVQVMRDLGGYSKVLNDCVHLVQEQLTSNPRAAKMLDAALRSLRCQIPEMRAQAQGLLNRVNLHAATAETTSHPTGRGRLGPGTYTELELRAPGIGWRGRADVVTVSEASCEILDFKTGVCDESHVFQIRVYALLWSRDLELNPSSRRADKLTLAYEGASVHIDAPTPSELESLESELIDRRKAATADVGRRPPEARPSVDNCRFCSVRQLCEDYWQSQRFVGPDAGAPDASFADLEVSIGRRHGNSSWDATVKKSCAAPEGASILLRMATPSPEIREHDRIRVLDAHLSEIGKGEGQPAVATLTSVSEVFLAQQPAGPIG